MLTGKVYCGYCDQGGTAGECDAVAVNYSGEIMTAPTTQ